MFEVWNYGRAFQGNRLSDITLPGGLVIPSGKDWAGIAPGSIPFIGNQPGVNTEGWVANQRDIGPGDYASKLQRWIGRGGGGWWLTPSPSPAAVPPSAQQCGPGTNDPNCTGGMPQCPGGQVFIAGQCRGGPELGPPI